MRDDVDEDVAGSCGVLNFESCCFVFSSSISDRMFVRLFDEVLSRFEYVGSRTLSIFIRGSIRVDFTFNILLDDCMECFEQLPFFSLCGVLVPRNNITKLNFFPSKTGCRWEIKRLALYLRPNHGKVWHPSHTLQ